MRPPGAGEQGDGRTSCKQQRMLTVRFAADCAVSVLASPATGCNAGGVCLALGTLPAWVSPSEIAQNSLSCCNERFLLHTWH